MGKRPASGVCVPRSRHCLLVRRDLATAVRTGQLLLEARELEFVPCSDVFLDTVKLFSSQKNTSLSFADVAIAAIALTRADGRVLAFDAGFRKVKGLRLATI